MVCKQSKQGKVVHYSNAHKKAMIEAREIEGGKGKEAMGCEQETYKPTASTTVANSTAPQTAGSRQK